jgi:phage N-6-adenine-methyltransferase
MMSVNQSWETPWAFIGWLENEFVIEFDLDAAATEENTKAPHFIDEEMDSFKTDWFGTVWLNPPFGKGGGNIKRFVQRAIEQRDNCEGIYILIPARTDTLMFHELLIPNADVIHLIKGRFNFIHPSRTKGANATFPSMLIEFFPNCKCSNCEGERPHNDAVITTLEVPKEARGF